MKSKADGLKTTCRMLLWRRSSTDLSGYGKICKLDRLMDGKGFYGALYMKTALEVNRKGNEFRTGGDASCIPMCTHLEMEPDMSYLIQGSRVACLLIRKVLLSHQKHLLPEEIWPSACRHRQPQAGALKYHDEYMEPGGQKNTHPERAYHPVLLYVRQKMFVLLKGKEHKSNQQRKAANSSRRHARRLHVYRLIVFVLLGPEIKGNSCVYDCRYQRLTRSIRAEEAKKEARKGSRRRSHWSHHRRYNAR
jgi:hypothetical protein